MFDTNSYLKRNRTREDFKRISRRETEKWGNIGNILTGSISCMNQIDGLYYMAARKMGIKDNTPDIILCSE